MVLKHVVTGVDNETYDIGRICILLGMCTFVGMEIYSVVFGSQTWNPETFGIGFTSVLAGGGFALRLKQDTEPKSQPPAQPPAEGNRPS